MMRCSRRGVILYKYFANGYFVAYTSPPPTAEPLLKEKPFGECICQLSTPALPDYQAPVAADSAAGRRACAARPKGKYSRGRMALAPIRARRIFPATGAGGAAGGQGHSQFNSINFYVTHRFFVTFFPEESNVPPVPSFLPLLTPSRTARPRTCRACAPWSGRSARPRRPRWSAHSGWDQNPSPWP